MNAIETTHKLDFLSKPWERDPEWHVFKIGTCHGQWRATKDAYEILSVVNENPGNGHFGDVLEWFEFACKRDKRALRIREVWNKGLMKHLFEKRGFIYGRGDDMVKYFR
jgi:hypothetical protein